MPAVKGREGQTPYMIEDMQALAREHSGYCLSTEYRDVKTKLRWQCAQGHIWDSSPDNVKAGSWCRICSKARRDAKWLQEMRAMAQARGGKCLSDRYVASQAKLRWQCAEGHIWEATPAGLRIAGSWCPLCGFEKLRLKIEDMHAIAHKRGGECLSTHYVNNETKLRWRCKQGHEWDAKPVHIRLGRWCPPCGREWRKLKMEEIHAMARARGGICLSTHYDNDGQKLRWRCASGHEWSQIPSKIKRGAWCAKCVGPWYTIADMRALAQSRGGDCLSALYIDTNTKLDWQCERGHVWSTRPAVIIRGCWCPNCAILERAQNRLKRMKYDVEG